MWRLYAWADNQWHEILAMSKADHVHLIRAYDRLIKGCSSPIRVTRIDCNGLLNVNRQAMPREGKPLLSVSELQQLALGRCLAISDGASESA